MADEDDATLSDDEKPSSDESVAKSSAGSEVDDDAVVAVDVVVPALLVDEAFEARLEMAVSSLEVVADSALSGPAIAATAEISADIGVDCDCFGTSFVSGDGSEAAMALLLLAAAALPLADEGVVASLGCSCLVAAELSCASRSGASGHLTRLSVVWCMSSRRRRGGEASP